VCIFFQVQVMLVPRSAHVDVSNFRFAGAVTGPAHALRRQRARTAASILMRSATMKP
jgi:hypothetical protein